MAATVVPRITGYHPTSLDDSLPTPTRTPIMQNGQPPHSDNTNLVWTDSFKISCIKELNDKKNFTPESLNYLMYLLGEEIRTQEHPPRLRIMVSTFLDLSATALSRGKPSKFLAPIYHRESKGHWSIVFVSEEIEVSSDTTYIRALHYDSQPHQKRSQDVMTKLTHWVEGHYGKDMKLRFWNVDGPVHDQRYGSGQFAVMAAVEFAKFGTINLKNPRTWDVNSGQLIMDILNGKRVALRQDPSQSTMDDTPSKLGRPKSAPSTALHKKQSGSEFPSYKGDMFKHPDTAPEPSHERRRGRSTSSIRSDRRSQTPSNLSRKWAGIVHGSAGSKPPFVDAREPTSKRRRIEGSLKLNMDNKDIIAQLPCPQLPTRSSLMEESDKRIADLHEKEQRLKGGEDALNENAQEFANYTKKFIDADSEHKSAEDQVDKKVQEKNAHVAKYRKAPAGFEDGLADEDMADIAEMLNTKLMEKVINPMRVNVEDKLKQKRKMSAMVKSLGDQRPGL
ncbi:hypothetical protein FVEN_g190 [Fusarium venenatum]|uniref:Uncharacterized protein n=1 Tax=Fusarium venenatum TaxID=56646 RepID=A0A2L2T693_9HYPO|nr:uncharacterized protein FVRRES_07709 [Fusarium venenatum]KAG8362384.1 hypothetical protein FVEN_g190 [Fusarium venenatum]CEI63273.1 unnamed protein product [Fusarium venenatum]